MLDVMIAGGGIGGLIAGLCIARAGFTVQIYEKVPVIGSIGYGIGLQPYCTKLLHELGLDDEVKKISMLLNEARFHSRNGQVIYHDKKGIAAGYKWPMYAVSRAELQKLLMKYFLKEVGENGMVLNHELISFESLADYVEVRFLNRENAHIEVARAKVLIGADGIKSAVRRILYPDEGLPIWSGVRHWYGLTPVNNAFLNGHTISFIGNPNRKFMLFHPVSEHLINWHFSMRFEQPRSEWIDKSRCNTIERLEDIIPLAEEFKLDYIDIPNMIKETIFAQDFPIVDRDPIPRWTFDRVTLLGDAAHPMYPYGGSAASQAVVDARILVQCFRKHGIIQQALNEYDELRRPNATAVVLLSRDGAYTKFLRIVDERVPDGVSDIFDIIPKEESEDIFAKYKETVGLDIKAMNDEPNLF